MSEALHITIDIGADRQEVLCGVCETVQRWGPYMSLFYMYTVRSRETGEILFQGRKEECCAFLGCSANTLYRIAIDKHKNSAFAQRYLITHEQCQALDRKDIICEECGCVVRNVDKRKRLCPACAQRREKERRARDRASAKKKESMQSSLRHQCARKKRYSEICAVCRKTVQGVFFSGEGRISKPATTSF